MADWGTWIDLAGKAVDFGVGLYEKDQRDDFTNDYSAFLQSKEQNDYDRYLAEVDAIKAQSEVQAQYLHEALAQQERARQEMLALYAPFIDSAKRLLPQKEALAKQGGLELGNLWNSISTPEAVGQLNNIPTSAAVQANHVLPGGIKR